MPIARPFKVVGVGTALPSQRVTSEELEAKLGLPMGWSEKYSGVKERRYAAEGETNAVLGAKALSEALNVAGLGVADLDVVVAASGTYDYPLPNNACIILHELAPKVGGIAAVDIDTTCLSFMTGLDYAARLLQDEDIDHVAVVSVEIASRGLNPGHKESSTLFGDGAAAIILTKDPTGEHGLVRYCMETYPEAAKYTIIQGGGNAYPFQKYPYDPVMHSFQMEGKRLLRLGKKLLNSFVPSFFDHIPGGMSHLDMVIPHQASKTGLYMFEKMYPALADKTVGNLSTRGNCIAASIPTILAEQIQAGKLNSGQFCFSIGTAAGLSVGAFLIRL